MNTPKVSIVIPVYNVERYLRQCLDSVISQTLKDIEIICVNDGSTDSSLSILEEYAKRDERVCIIDKPNGGYGHSMNKGFDQAKGEYIGIIESDDYADPDMFEKLYACAKEHNLDVVKSGFYFYYSKNGEQSIPNPIASHITSSRTFCPIEAFRSKMEMVDFFNIKPTIWSAIYRKEFIRSNNIRFNETPGASYQDASFNFKVWVCAQRVRLMEECFLHYRQDNEASSINSPGKVYCICDEYDEMARFLKLHPYAKGKVEPIMVRIKYDSYNWNYERLAEPLQAEFIQRFCNDFKQHEIDGTLQKSYFEWYKWNTIQKIIDNPQKYHMYQVMRKNGEELPPCQNDNEKLAPITFRYFMNKLIGGYYCLQEHGIRYTWDNLMGKIRRRMHK